MMNAADGRQPQPLAHERVPCGPGLLQDDAARREGAGVHEHADDRQSHRRLVAQHLRRGAHRAEQRVLRPRRPAGEHDAVHAEAGHGEEPQHADRGVGELQERLMGAEPHDAAERDDGEGEEHGEGGHERCDEVHRLVGHGRRRMLLEEQLDPVGEGLEHPEGAGLVGSDPVLHVGDDLAHEPDVDEHRDEQQPEDDERLHDQDDHDGEVDAVVEQRVAAGKGVHGMLSTRRSVTVVATSMRSGAPGPATFTGMNAVPATR